jgi:D-alanyl-D-alanine carboxypeptidase
MMAGYSQGDGSARMRLSSLSPAYRLAFVGVLATAFVIGSSCDGAQARAPRQHAKQAEKKQGKHRPIHGPNYNPPYADIVVDANSDQVLHEANPDAPRHPASLTKVMTLYMLFEQIEAGKFKLDTPLQVSTHASLQTPTKLGLKANSTISVEDAIKGMCTRSANDAAVVVAEAVGGTETDFARLMTEKARALGMSNTTYVNASGLPAEEQITTARDQAILGRAVQDRFPTYYRYFSTLTFRYRGKEIHNHNGLLGQVRGMDGIKTGYTEASGYNLLSSVRRDERHIVAVVLGGKSGAARNEKMRELIEGHILRGSARRTAPPILEAANPTNPKPSAPAENAAPTTALPAARVTPLEAAGSTSPTISLEPVPAVLRLETMSPQEPPVKPQAEAPSSQDNAAKPAAEAPLSSQERSAKPQPETQSQQAAKPQVQPSPAQDPAIKRQAPARAAVTRPNNRRPVIQTPARATSLTNPFLRPDPRSAW